MINRADNLKDKQALQNTCQFWEHIYPLNFVFAPFVFVQTERDSYLLGFSINALQMYRDILKKNRKGKTIFFKNLRKYFQIVT